MRVALQATCKKSLQINVSDSEFMLEIIEKGLKLTFSSKTAFRQDEQNIMI